MRRQLSSGTSFVSSSLITSQRIGTTTKSLFTRNESIVHSTRSVSARTTSSMSINAKPKRMMTTTLATPPVSKNISQLIIHKRDYSTFFSRGKAHAKSRPLAKQLWELRKNPITILFFGTVLVVIPVGSALYYNHYEDTVPYTGRKRLMDISLEEEERLGLTAFHALKQQFQGHILPDNHRHTQAVKRVANSIIKHTNLTHLNWEFFVIDSPEVNAFVIPGGKVFVFTGILPVLHDEEGMATCLSHEIAHVVARHGVEKWSKGRLTRLLAVVASLFSNSTLTIGLFEHYAMSLPFSRKFETEADYIGLMLLAKACYDPNRAVELWERMSEEVHSVPQYLSTHPTHDRRVEKIKEWMPKARNIKNKCCKHTNPDRWFAYETRAHLK